MSRQTPPAPEFSFSNGPLYAEKDEYISKNLVFAIMAIKYEPKAGFEGTDRWAITVSVDDGRPDEIITLQSNEERDAQLTAAAAHLEKHGPIRNATLVKRGKAFYIQNATAIKTP